jgi:hypothetical protein
MYGWLSEYGGRCAVFLGLGGKRDIPAARDFFGLRGQRREGVKGEGFRCAERRIKRF